MAARLPASVLAQIATSSSRSALVYAEQATNQKTMPKMWTVSKIANKSLRQFAAQTNK
jgi:hypothetical protein